MVRTEGDLVEGVEEEERCENVGDKVSENVSENDVNADENQGKRIKEIQNATISATNKPFF